MVAFFFFFSIASFLVGYMVEQSGRSEQLFEKSPFPRVITCTLIGGVYLSTFILIIFFTTLLITIGVTQ